MKLQQLKYIVEVHRRGNHISAAAEALHTSQPGLSKQIQLLESELGVEIFQRKRNRVVGLTDPGREVLEIAQRILNDVDNLKSVREEYDEREQGTLTIATTHTYARYVLPHVVEKFMRRYPRVKLGLHQGTPTQICEAVEAGEADFALGTEAMRPFPRLTLQELAQYPIIAHDRQRSGSWKVMDAFRRAGLEPNIIFGAVDADVCKTYVELGLGVAILATVAVDPAHDRDLRARDASHLFESSTTYISLRQHSYLRRYVYDFITTLAPALTPEVVRAAVQGVEPQPPQPKNHRKHNGAKT
jgi:LysR family transcriptional regulator, cys regulon transcriptional activator